jgi:hypothetical protein
MRNKRTVFLVLLLLVAVALLFAALAYRNSKRDRPSESATQQTSDTEEKTSQGRDAIVSPPNTFPPVPPEVSVVRSYSGTVTAHDLEEKSITIATMQGLKEITYTGDTLLSLQSVTAPPTSSQDPIVTTSVLPSASDIAIGDTVTALSPTNIRGKTSFEASELILIQ